jgi:Polyketide cyclase / dehydrase and lipid transport
MSHTVAMLLLVIVVLIAAFLLFAASRPNGFRVQRTARIKAPPEKIFPLIDNFHDWVSWSPYEKIDPALQRSYSGAERGRGAVYEWQGNNKVGKGRMEITQSSPPAKIVIALHFIKPFEARNTAEFTMAPEGDATSVTWAMHGSSPFVAKVMCIFMSMDNMVGKQFEEGLANLKTVAERCA